MPGISDKARLARIRNFKIMRLRGIYTCIADLMTDPLNITSIQDMIDKELQSLGAEREADRKEQRKKALDMEFGS